MGELKVVITGASTYGVSNHGDDAMLANLVQGIRRSHANANIVFISRHPDEKMDKAFGFRSIKNLDHDSKKLAEGRIFNGFNSGDSTSHLKEIANAIGDADLLVIGGNSLMEIFPNGFLQGVSSYAATLATLAKFSQVPYALYGLNVVEKLEQSTTKQHAKFLIENAALVTCRESSCVTFLEAVDIDCSRVKVMGDPAYGMLIPDDVETVNTEQYRNKLAESRVVGAAFRFHYWENDEGKVLEVSQRIARILDRIVAQLDCMILMIPNCTYEHGHKWQDDRLAHRLIREKMIEKESVICVEEKLTVFETLDLFELVELHISNRRHSCIFSALKHRPFIALDGPFAGHMAPFLKDLSLSDRLVLEHEETRTLQLAGELWASTQKRNRYWIKHVEEHKKSAQTQVKEILRLVKRTNGIGK